MNSSEKKEYNRAYYTRTKDRYKAQRAESRDRIKRESLSVLRTLKESNPCTDCKMFYPYYVMQYDHIGNDKWHEVSRLANHGVEQMLLEIAKCELVCANCHAARTHQRRGPVVQR